MTIKHTEAPIPELTPEQSSQLNGTSILRRQTSRHAYQKPLLTCYGRFDRLTQQPGTSGTAVDCEVNPNDPACGPEIP